MRSTVGILAVHGGEDVNSAQLSPRSALPFMTRIGIRRILRQALQAALGAC
jgi:hypothetical protein